MTNLNTPPILINKVYTAQSVFVAENLLRQARRQKSIPKGNVPAICVLDPDGDLVQYLRDHAHAQPNPHWACYHTEMYDFALDGITCGIVGNAVGAPFAVLVAEEMFASGCQFLISITSAGQITLLGPPPYFVLITRALRDEGTSYHYLPSASYSELNPRLLATMASAFHASPISVQHGATWTTDAPFRETADAIAFARSEGILGVEMEAAALYALAQVKGRDIVCFAHITNQMGNVENDFEKGAAQGSASSIKVIRTAAHGWLKARDLEGLRSQI
jgi:uridine phosphorylase